MVRSSYGHPRSREHAGHADPAGRAGLASPVSHMVRTTSTYPTPINTWLSAPTDADGGRVFSGAFNDNRPGRDPVRGFVPSRMTAPAGALGEAATATEAAEFMAHVAQTSAAREVTAREEAAREAAAVDGQGVGRGAIRSRFQLSPAATAFSLEVGREGSGSHSGPGSRSDFRPPLGRDISSAESRERWHSRQDVAQQQHAVRPTADDARGDFFAAVAAARAIAADRRPGGEDSAAAAAAAAAGSYGQGGRTPAPGQGQGQIDDAYRELLSARASYMAALSSVSSDGTPPFVSSSAAATSATVAAENVATRSRRRDLSTMLPAFRRWEAQVPQLQIQVSGHCFWRELS